MAEATAVAVLIIVVEKKVVTGQASIGGKAGMKTRIIGFGRFKVVTGTNLEPAVLIPVATSCQAIETVLREEPAETLPSQGASQALEVDQVKTVLVLVVQCSGHPRRFRCS